MASTSSPAVAGRRMTMGLLAFHGLTQLDLTGPYEVLSRAPNATVLIISCHPGELTIRTEHGLKLLADTDLDGCQDTRLDLLLVPGGPGQLALMEDARVLGFIRHWAATQADGPWKYLTSVCTGALVLAATGLLAPQPPAYRRVQATTHWLFRPLLEALKVDIDVECALADGHRPRVVWSSVETRVRAEEGESGGESRTASFTLVTGGGITAGIDFGLDIVKRLHGEETCQSIMLALEYDPAPPSQIEHVATAVCERVEGAASELLEKRWAAVHRIRRRLGMDKGGAGVAAGGGRG